jgi:hypothetical protein
MYSSRFVIEVTIRDEVIGNYEWLEELPSRNRLAEETLTPASMYYPG